MTSTQKRDTKPFLCSRIFRSLFLKFSNSRNVWHLSHYWKIYVRWHLCWISSVLFRAAHKHNINFRLLCFLLVAFRRHFLRVFFVWYRFNIHANESNVVTLVFINFRAAHRAMSFVNNENGQCAPAAQRHEVPRVVNDSLSLCSFTLVCSGPSVSWLCSAETQSHINLSSGTLKSNITRTRTNRTKWKKSRKKEWDSQKLPYF